MDRFICTVFNNIYSQKWTSKLKNYIYSSHNRKDQLPWNPLLTVISKASNFKSLQKTSYDTKNNFNELTYSQTLISYLQKSCRVTIHSLEKQIKHSIPFPSSESCSVVQLKCKKQQTSETTQLTFNNIRHFNTTVIRTLIISALSSTNKCLLQEVDSKSKASFCFFIFFFWLKKHTQHKHDLSSTKFSKQYL